MASNPFILLENSIIVFCSEIFTDNSKECVCLQFKKVGSESNCSAYIDFPIGSVRDVTGFSSEDLEIICKRIPEIGPIALQFEKLSKQNNTKSWDEIKAEYPHCNVGLTNIQYVGKSQKIKSAVVLCSAKDTPYDIMCLIAAAERMHVRYTTFDEDWNMSVTDISKYNEVIK